MDSSESSLVSGDLTSTMENVSVTNDQGESSSKSESTYVGDSVPSSSSDANVQATVLKAVLDDPISSTSDTINSVSEMNLKSACDVHLELGAESQGGASNVSELVTDTDFFSSELNIGSICTEKISEDVEDIANDLENLLGESSHEYSISSNTDKSFDLDPFESHSKTTFEGATQTKDITTTDTSENALINLEKLTSVSSHKPLFEEESLSTADAIDTIGHSAGPSGNADQISESENVSASASENVEDSKPDIKCAEYKEFVIREEVVDTKPEIVAEDDQSDDEEVYGMILQIRDDNQDSTTGDEARTEEDSQESLPQRDWSVKTPNSEETATSNVDLADIGNDQVCTGFQNQDTTSKEPFSLFETQKESGDGDELETKDQENKITVDSCADSQPDKSDMNTSDFVEENVPEEEENNDTNRESDLIKIQTTEVSDEDESVEHVEDSADCAAEKLLKNDNESGEVSSNVIENAVFSLEDTENENKNEIENVEEERADDEKKLFEIAEDQPEEPQTVLNHLETTSVEDLTATGASSAEVTQQSIDSIDSDIVTKLTEESENLNVKESDHNFTNTLDENEENIELIAEDDDKKEENIGAIVREDDEREEDGVADVEDVIKSESLNADDIQRTSEDCTEENNGQTDVQVSTETLNVADETAEHSEDKIARNSEELIKESECPKPGPLPDLSEFQINSLGECDKKEDQVLASDTTKNDLLDTEAATSMETEDAMEENLIQNENEQLRDSIPDGEAQSKSEESPREASALFTSFEDLVKESLNDEIPDVTQNMSEAVDCLTDTGNSSTTAEELAEIQFGVISEQEHVREPHNKEVVSEVENQLVTAESEQERPCESDNKEAGGSIQLVDVEENLEMKDASFHSNDNADTEKTETNESTDDKVTESAEDSNLITNNANVPQISSISEVNDETISLELKVLQSLEESVEAICAISKEETANKETESFFQESENSETTKFAALDDAEILDANSELQKEEPDGSLSVDVECFNSAQFVAEVQSVEDCVQLQIDGGSTQDKEMLPDNEAVDVASMETQDGSLADEILQKEIENLEEQNVVFPILEDNFEDAIESHQDIEDVQQSDLTKFSEVDDQFEVNEACKYIEANDVNADETQDSEETIIETIELQLVEDDKDSVEQTEEYESISATEDIADPKVEEELTQKSVDDESTSLSNVIVEEADEQTVKPEEGNGNAKELESVCIEEIPDGAVITEIESELKPTTVEPLIDMPEEEAPSEVSSSLIIETEPQSKGEKSYQQSPSADEHKRQDSEYSSKMSSDQDLKMTIRKHRIEDTQKYESEGHSILKIFDSHESIDDKEKDPVPRLIIKPIVKPSAVVSVEEVVPKITIKPILGRSSPSEAQLSPKMMKATNRPDSPKVTRSQKCDMLSPLKLTIKPVLKPEEMQQQKSSPKLTIKPIQKVDESSVSSPKITIKPIIKPSEEDVVHSPKITIKPIVKPPEQECEMLLQSPRITIKPVVKPTDSPKKSPERDHSPRITIKPIVKPAEEKIAKDSTETSHNPRITIKPLIKPEESKSGKQDGSKKTEQEVTSAETSSHSPRITIKPIVKPVDEQKQSKQESSTGSPKITIKPIVRPQEVEEDSVRLIDFEEQIKQERIVLKINKTTKSTRKRQAAEATEKLAKIKVKYSRERGRAQIVSEQGKLKRALEGSLDPDFKRTRFESGDLTITPINPTVQIEKIETPLPEKSGVTVVGIDDPLEKIPIFEITPESAAVLKTPLVEVQPLPPAPRKRGRPRKVPLVVREDLDAVVKEEKVVEPVATPPVEDTGRPKRSCRGPSVRTTLGIRARRPRGSSRGRGRGRGSRGGGTRGGRQQRLSAAKLKLLKEEAASAIAEETKRLDNEQKDVEMKEEVPENVDAGTTNSELVIIEEETRMSADINSSRAQTPAKQVLTPAPGDVEDTQSSVQSTATTESVKVRKGTRLEVHQEPEGEVISAEQLTEYYWGGGGPYMLQEQVAQFLGIKSFKRKYPGITRRPVDMQERDFIRESGLASEAMCDLGLTAVSSADILDIMYSDFQNKYEEYCKHQRDRQAKDFSNKQKALSLAASQEKNKQDIMQQAVQSAASWNASFNKARRDDRKSCMDLQTFTVHYPKGKMKKIDQPKVGFYPVALVPGQYTDYYKTFTPTELNNLPLNTMLYEPININDEDSHSDGSGSDSDSSSSSSGSSSSDSSDDNCNVCSPASSTNKKAISTTN